MKKLFLYLSILLLPLSAFAGWPKSYEEKVQAVLEATLENYEYQAELPEGVGIRKLHFSHSERGPAAVDTWNRPLHARHLWAGNWRIAEASVAWYSGGLNIYTDIFPRSFFGDGYMTVPAFPSLHLFDAPEELLEITYPGGRVYYDSSTGNIYQYIEGYRSAVINSFKGPDLTWYAPGTENCVRVHPDDPSIVFKANIVELVGNYELEEPFLSFVENME